MRVLDGSTLAVSKQPKHVSSSNTDIFDVQLTDAEHDTAAPVTPGKQNKIPNLNPNSNPSPSPSANLREQKAAIIIKASFGHLNHTHTLLTCSIRRWCIRSIICQLPLYAASGTGNRICSAG
jgi:hypothetical protein